MSRAMPPAEVEVSADLVFRLLTTQRPQLAGLEVESLAHGWDNVSFRVGEELVARFPRRQLAVELLANEARWLPDLARRLPLPIPAPVFMGRAEHGYPWPWALVPWIPGLSAAVSTGLDLTICASSLGGFLAALHAKAPADAPVYPYRGVPLNTRDDVTRERIALLEATTDRRVALASWDHALGAQQFEDEARWLHGDLHPHNLLTVDGGLSGVADFGDITSGDPATDLAIAWMLFPVDTRALFRQEYGGIDEATWARARGWAFSLAAYLTRSADNPVMHAIGLATMEYVLADG